MTDIVRRFIKTGILFLVCGLLLGAFMLVRREMYGDWPNAYAISAHTHVVFVGFVMFMILGVALWIFPKPLEGDRRYRPILIEVVFWLLSLGTLTRFVGELVRAYSEVHAMAWPPVLGGFAQVTALLIYVWTMWTRIRPSARQMRIARGGEVD